MLSVTEAKPSLLKISDTLSVRFQKTGSGPPLLLIHTIRTQLEYFRSLTPLLARSHTVYAIDLPGHGHSPIDRSASFDEPYFRRAVIRLIEQLDLSALTIVGESIGGALALTVAAALPERVKRVYAINPYDYETRYGDGIRRGNWFSNFIIGSLQIPVLGAVNASLENKMILGKIMGGGYRDPRKLPADLLAEFDEVAHRPGYKRIARKVLAGWRSWSKAADYYRSDLGASDTHLWRQRLVSSKRARAHPFADPFRADGDTEKHWPLLSSRENPSELARLILAAELPQ